MEKSRITKKTIESALKMFFNKSYENKPENNIFQFSEFTYTMELTYSKMVSRTVFMCGQYERRECPMIDKVLMCLPSWKDDTLKLGKNVGTYNLDIMHAQVKDIIDKMGTYKKYGKAYLYEMDDDMHCIKIGGKYVRLAMLEKIYFFFMSFGAEYVTMYDDEAENVSRFVVMRDGYVALMFQCADAHTGDKDLINTGIFPFTEIVDATFNEDVSDYNWKGLNVFLKEAEDDLKRSKTIYKVELVKYAYKYVLASNKKEAYKIARKFVDDDDFEDSSVEVESAYECDSKFDFDYDSEVFDKNGEVEQDIVHDIYERII